MSHWRNRLPYTFLDPQRRLAGQKHQADVIMWTIRALLGRMLQAIKSCDALFAQ
jgi:hypothetical protein